MVIIGITGGSGSGKSIFSHYIGQLCHAPVIDADEVYHQLVDHASPCTAALAEAFGPSVLCADGSLNRPLLASLVFADGADAAPKRVCLNEITHAYVRAAFYEQIEAYKKKGIPLLVLDVPLLFESGFSDMCDRTVSVLAPKDLRLSRIIQRDGLDIATAERRLAAQPLDEFYISKSHYTVYNDGDLKTLQLHAARIVDDLVDILQ